MSRQLQHHASVAVKMLELAQFDALVIAWFFATFTNAVSSFQCQCIVRHLDPPYQILGLTEVN